MRKLMLLIPFLVGALVGIPAGYTDDKKTVEPVSSEPILEGNNLAPWMGEVKVRNVPVGSAVIWDVKPEDNVSVRIIKTEKAVLFAGAKGTYKVRCRIIKGEETIADLDKTVMITNPGPEPDPFPPVPPTPPDPPTPIPTGKIAKFVVVEDTSKAGQWRGDVLASPKVQAYYRSAGLQHLVISTKAALDGAVPPEIQAYLDLSRNKELPYLWTYDKEGKLLNSGKAPTDPDGFVGAIGGTGETPRAMGNLPPEEGRLKAKWKVFGESVNTPLVPRKDWKPVNLRSFLPPVHDQDGRGQCNASATCTAVEACRSVAGLPYVYLSAGDLYSQINGGKDNGSFLEDGLASMLKNGVSSTASVPYVWDGRNHSVKVTNERLNYRVVEAYVCPDFDAMASALQQGFFIIEGLVWYDNFTPDRDGWLPQVGRGGAGGHALCGYGLSQRNGVWGIQTRNSWGPGWGIGGDCIIPEKLFDQRIGGYWAVRSVIMTPTNFPVPKVELPKKFKAFDTEFALTP